MKVHVNSATAETAVCDIRSTLHSWRFILNLMVSEYLINVFVFVRCFTSFHSHVPLQHFSTSGEEHWNVASILLQWALSDLESSFDCLLSYQDWPLMCWTYAHWVSPEICKYYVLVAHTEESVKIAVFHLFFSHPPTSLCTYSSCMVFPPLASYAESTSNFSHLPWFM